jgi:hypothetical protein
MKMFEDFVCEELGKVKGVYGEVDLFFVYENERKGPKYVFEVACGG